jgi:Core-2/I-Branching enzyme
MSPGAAAVILAHSDPEEVRRLIGALGDLDVFLHCDSRTPDGVVRQMLANAPERVWLVPRGRADWFCWSLVDAELRGLRLALEQSPAEHIIIMSGSCYPLISGAELQDELAAWRGLSRFELNPLPYRAWDTPHRHDGGLWRFNRRVVTWRGRSVSVGGVPLSIYRRPIPEGLQLHASAQWKIYARSHAAALLRILSERPDLERFWRTTFGVEEACVASMLRSPAVSGPIAEEVRDDLAWYIDWHGDGPVTHPAWLGSSHFPTLRAARLAPRRDPGRPEVGAPDRDAFRKLFARKLSSRELQLLDRIDQELRT